VNDTDQQTEKVNAVKQLFQESGAADATRNAVKEYTLQSQNILDRLEEKQVNTTDLKAFSEALLVRSL
jgi:geranylgeranyl diphosphate synthase type II